MSSPTTRACEYSFAPTHPNDVASPALTIHICRHDAGNHRAVRPPQLPRSSICLEFIIRGTFLAEADNQATEMRAGCLRVFPLSEDWNYTDLSPSPSERISILFSVRRHSNFCPSNACLAPASESGLKTIFQMIQLEASETNPNRKEICEKLLEVLILKINCLDAHSREYSADSTQATYESVRQIIREHATELMSLTDIADVAGLTASYLCRLFKRFGETSPYKYLMQQKMQHAHKLLVEGRCNVSETAHELGFDSPFNFSRAFKNVYDLPPNRFKSIDKELPLE